MAVDTFNFTTGPSTLPDIGTLSYNGCVFSPLFTTQVTGAAIKDEAQRTTKYMEYTIKVDGYVTTPNNDDSIKRNMVTLRKLLTEQGGALVYRGRGCDIIVNNGSDLDVSWGPSPEVLEFQPLGGGVSAKIVWQCKVKVNEQKRFLKLSSINKSGGTLGININGGQAPLLQFNYGSTVSYGEDGYSKLDVQGVLEIPLTRIPNQKTRTLQQTADTFRGEIEAHIMNGIDLNKFRVTNRTFNLSRDKRILEWQFSAEELPYQQMPPDCTIVRGNYSVRPAKAGMGLCSWLCNLRVTYTVRADRPRRTAWLAFHNLLRYRMLFSRPFTKEELQKTKLPPIVKQFILENKMSFLVDFNIDEGLYLDSKTITFSATWKMVAQFSAMFLASGLWKKLPETGKGGNNLWAISMADVEGSQSWLSNTANPNTDLIVDFGM